MQADLKKDDKVLIGYEGQPFDRGVIIFASTEAGKKRLIVKKLAIYGQLVFYKILFWFDLNSQCNFGFIWKSDG